MTANKGQGSVLGILIVLVALIVLVGVFYFVVLKTDAKVESGESSAERFDFEELRHYLSDDSCMYEEGHDRDSDDDGIVDSCDNCVLYYNPLQGDKDLDGIGDVCDLNEKDSDDDEEEEEECSSDSDCGEDRFIGSKYCDDGDVVQKYKEYDCDDGECDSETTEVLIEDCLYDCSAGECLDPPTIPCSSDSDCDDGDLYTEDFCVNPGQEDSTCDHSDIRCIYESDCGVDGFIDGTKTCVGDSVHQGYMDVFCLLAGSSDSSCSFDSYDRHVEVCDYACANGVCVRCDDSWDCYDGDLSTDDVCVNPGQEDSRCENPLIGTCTSGETQSCGSSDVGECSFGERVCVAGYWSSCFGAIDPVEEICDGLDNDCDGSTDEEGVCDPGCVDECVAFERECLDLDHYRVCADFNGDGCTTWSLTGDCGFGSECSGGYCV